MNRVAIAFSSCDRVELTKRSIEPLFQPDKFDLHWVDGSKTEEGKFFTYRVYDSPILISTNKIQLHQNINGGSGSAIVYALTKLLKKLWEKPGTKATSQGYDYIGLVENDVLLHDGWFDDMMALFERGEQDGLKVGAVSARCYEDRILIQRDGYAVMHNLGAGMIVFTREAAEIVLQTYRTVWTTENRLLFSQLSGIDIGRYWAFRGDQHFLVADWRFDMILAAHGFVSLALTPNRATMLDQDIAPLGLKYADGNFALACNSAAFERYRDNLARIRAGDLAPGINHPFYHDGQAHMIFAHQVPQIGGSYAGNWRVRDFQGFGPFCWVAGGPALEDESCGTQRVSDQLPTATLPIVGPCDLVVSGGKIGGKVCVVDAQSGFNVDLDLPAEGSPSGVLQIAVPGSAVYRDVVLTALTPGICFFGVRTREKQPWLPQVRFDYSTLPLA